MQSVKTDNLEQFYDVLDESNNLLYDVFKLPYFELIEMTVNNILAGEILTDLDKENTEKLQAIYDRLEGVDFSVEDVRKAMQSIVLRGFKEMRIPNGNTTPDTLGIFITYLLTKLCPDKKISILDPLAGTGNLLLTVANHLDKDVSLFACDNDPWMAKLIELTSNLLNTQVEIFLQDTFNLSMGGLDAVIFDMPHCEYDEAKKEYFPYKAMLHYMNMLNDKGCMIGIVENDFFNYDSDKKFKGELLNTMAIIGLIELPDSMFKTSKPKIIVVLERKSEVEKKCFMVKLPSFSDAKEFNNSLIDIETWFEKNNYNKKSEEF